MRVKVKRKPEREARGVAWRGAKRDKGIDKNITHTIYP